MSKFLNLRIPFIFRLIAVLIVVVISASIVPYNVGGYVGGIIFLLIYLSLQLEAMEMATKSSCLGSILGFLSEKGKNVSIWISVMGLLYGSFIFLTSGDDTDMMYMSACAVVYPIVSVLFGLRRLRLAAKHGDGAVMASMVKYWGPFALTPVFSALLATYLVKNIGVGVVVCGVILAFFILTSVVSSIKDSAASSAHTDDQSSTSHWLTSNYHAKWDNLSNTISGSTYYVEGHIIVEYEGDRDTFSQSEADSTVRELLQKLQGDVRKKHSQCTSFDTSRVTVSYICRN